MSSKRKCSHIEHKRQKLRKLQLEIDRLESSRSPAHVTQDGRPNPLDHAPLDVGSEVEIQSTLSENVADFGSPSSAEETASAHSGDSSGGAEAQSQTTTSDSSTLAILGEIPGESPSSNRKIRKEILARWTFWTTQGLPAEEQRA